MSTFKGRNFLVGFVVFMGIFLASLAEQTTTVRVRSSSDCYKRFMDPDDTMYIEYNGDHFYSDCSIILDTADLDDYFCIDIETLRIESCGVELRIYNFDSSIFANKTFNCNDNDIPSYDLCTDFSDTRIEIEPKGSSDTSSRIRLKVYIIDIKDPLTTVWIIVGSVIGGLVFLACVIGGIIFCYCITRKRQNSPGMVYNAQGGGNVAFQYQAGAYPSHPAAYPTYPAGPQQPPPVPYGYSSDAPPPAYPVVTGTAGYPPAGEQQKTPYPPSGPTAN